MIDILMVSGSRNITDYLDNKKTIKNNKTFSIIEYGIENVTAYEIVKSVLDRFKFKHLIHGSASGVDNLSEEYCMKNDIPTTTEKYKPKWSVYGRAAGVVRNQLMVNDCSKGIAIWDRMSRGTLYSIGGLRKAGKLLKTVVVTES